MKFTKIFALVAFTILLSACAYVPLPYQKAVGWIHGGQGGYLDTEIKP